MSRQVYGNSFTLVEMLTVIAIICILASLLMPSLGKAINASRQSSCLNNLRQQGIAGMSYANDNNGWLPIGKNLFFSQTLSYVTSVPYSAYYQRTGKRLTVHACPVIDPASASNTNYLFDFRLGWYSLNTGLKNGYNGSSTDENAVCKMSRWKKPSSEFFRGDGGSSSWISKIEMYFIIDINMQTFGFIHNQSMSTLWLDGHASPESKDDLYSLYWNK